MAPVVRKRHCVALKRPEEGAGAETQEPGLTQDEQVHCARHGIPVPTAQELHQRGIHEREQLLVRLLGKPVHPPADKVMEVELSVETP